MKIIVISTLLYTLSFRGLGGACSQNHCVVIVQNFRGLVLVAMLAWKPSSLWNGMSLTSKELWLFETYGLQ